MKLLYNKGGLFVIVNNECNYRIITKIIKIKNIYFNFLCR